MSGGELRAAQRLRAWAASLSPGGDTGGRTQGNACGILETLGAALAGMGALAICLAHNLAQAHVTPAATAVGVKRRLSPLGAAFVNSTAAHAIDFDDNCYAVGLALHAAPKA